MTAKTIALVLATAAAGAGIAPLAAQQTDQGTILVCSRHGNECVTVYLRMTNLGPQYLSPGGTWSWCEGDCRDTVRRETVDFWEDQRERSR